MDGGLRITKKKLAMYGPNSSYAESVADRRILIRSLWNQSIRANIGTVVFPKPMTVSDRHFISLGLNRA